MNQDIYTNWAEATDSILMAFESAKGAILAGKNAWIEKRENVYEYNYGKKGCKFPMTTKNSGLNNPFNWTMLFGAITQKDYSTNYFNETEKDLHENYTVLFSTKKARNHYIKTGKVIKGLNNGIGICTPVKIEDANKTRTDGYKYKGKTIVWEPVSMEYRIPDPDITEVYVVCYNNGFVKEDEIIGKLKEIINNL